MRINGPLSIRQALKESLMDFCQINQVAMNTILFLFELVAMMYLSVLCLFCTPPLYHR